MTVFGAIALLLLAALLALITLPQAVRLETAMGMAQLIAFRGPLLIAEAVLLVFTLIVLAGSRNRVLPSIAVAVAAITVIANAGILFARGFASDAPRPEAANTITVLSWNTRGDEPGSPTIAKLALESGADVIALPETSEEMGEEVARIMGNEGRPMWVYSRTIDHEYTWTATTLLISPDLGEYQLQETVPDEGIPMVIAESVSGAGPTIVAAHPMAPLPNLMTQWRSELRTLASFCDGNMIMAGDFNSTLDHWAHMGRDGHDFGHCNDSATQAGSGAVGTWSAGIPAPLASPIDHVVATDQWRAIAARVVTDYDRAGSDHRPIVATLTADL